ncbi:MAG: DUF1631 domain-containing protein [Ketobacteraceae bacterium]|nr:DUF1631 domain-containing protein [Ketobacteraceae bacterium]
MNRDQERYNKHLSGHSVTRALPGIMRQVKENSLSILGNQINEFFNSCDDLFFELANHASSNNEQNLYFDSMREIRLKKKDVVNGFKDNFNAHFSDLVRPMVSQAAQGGDQYSHSFENLGLVEDDKMEQDVAISSIISKTRQDCQENLYHLSLRFDYLLSDIRVNENNNPLDPKQICEAFTRAATLMDLDIKARIILFKQFDRMVARHLNKIYSLANELLINAGILPKVVPSVIRNKSMPEAVKSTPAGQGAPQPASAAGSTGGEHGMEPSSGETITGGSDPALYTFEQLSSLLAGLKAVASTNPGLQAVSTGGQGYGNPISQDILLDQLTDLQRRLATEDGPQTREKFQTAIYQILQSTGEGGKPSSLDQTDEDVINLVSMFFEFILDDRNLPVPIQALVSRLQIPVLKIALKDKKFFNNSKHVARRLINDIAAMSIGWNDSTKDQQDQLFDLINDIVHKINDEFVGDLAVFEREVARLQDYKEKESKRARIVETRTNQAAEGKAKTDHTKSLVQNILLQRLNNVELPEIISTLLIQHWQKLLVLIKLKAGDSSPEWLSNLQVVDDLIWIAQPHSDERSRKRYERIMPTLLESLDKGLAAINMGSGDRQSLIQEVEKTLSDIQSDDSDPVARAPLKAAQLASLGQTPEGLNKNWKEMSALERQQVKQRALHFENVKKAESLKVGTWFVAQDEKTGKTTRCKLASYIKPNERFVFVNRFGQKTAEKSKQEVAMELQRQLLTPLDSGLLFDRAMSTIVDNLKKVNSSSSKQSTL